MKGLSETYPVQITTKTSFTALNFFDDLHIFFMITEHAFTKFLKAFQIIRAFL